MTDRLPAPMADEGGSVPVAERASATPARTAPRRAPTIPRPGAGERGAPLDLRAVQAWTVNAITGDDIAADEADRVVTVGPQLSARERLDIYRFGYTARLIECLVDDYPVLAATLGTDPFEAVASAYIERHPSTSPSLNAFGRHMAAFCRDAPVLVARESRGFFAELATLEWALVEAIHAPLPPPLDLAALQAIAPEEWGDVRLSASDSVRLLCFEYPVNAYFQAFRTGDAVPPIPSPSPTATAVYRRGLTLWRMDLTPAMTRVLGGLLAGVPLAEALARMGIDESDPAELAEAERSVMIWFREWVQAGFFAGLTRREPAVSGDGESHA